MAFDIVIGNPPYNDGNGAADKKGGSKHMKTNLYPGFIEIGYKLSKPDGIVAYILPHGAFNYFYKSNLFLTHVFFNPTKIWGKAIPTRSWIATKQPQNTAKIVTPIFEKIAKWEQTRVLNRQMKPGFKLYNYIRPLRVFSVDEINNMDEKEANKNNAPIFLPYSDQNKRNITFLLTFFNKFLDEYSAMWGSYSKTLDYNWLNGLTYDITEQHIKDNYGLTDDEISKVKNAKVHVEKK
jgi:hypothetical protein